MSEYDDEEVVHSNSAWPCDYCGREREECHRFFNETADEFRRVFGPKAHIWNPTMDCTFVMFELDDKKLGLYRKEQAKRALALFAQGAALTHDGHVIVVDALERLDAYIGPG